VSTVSRLVGKYSIPRWLAELWLGQLGADEAEVPGADLLFSFD